MNSDVVSTYLKRNQQRLHSPATQIGELLAKELKSNPHFYFFSPDETTSNRFDAIFGETARAWNLPIEPQDLPENQNGRIIEMLSENVLFSVMTGHLMNNEPAVMGSYEAFFPIITAQLLQQIKFFKQANQVEWRPKYPAVNLLSTSTCWRQDHNGFTHQSPALISTLLYHPAALANCFFPIDDLAAKTAFEYMLNSKNVVNLTTFNKIEEPRFLSPKEAKNELKNGGATILEKYSDDNPDIIFAAAGDIVAKEAICAIEILKSDLPELKIRFVNISALSYRSIGTTDCRLSRKNFEKIFTANKPIIANFHGYPETLENILENYTYRGRLRVHGFNEEGSTTTPFEMLRRNAASRFNLTIDVAKLLNRNDLVIKYQSELKKNHEHAIKTSEDLLK